MTSVTWLSGNQGEQGWTLIRHATRLCVTTWLVYVVVVATGRYYAWRTAVGLNESKLNYGEYEVVLGDPHNGECQDYCIVECDTVKSGKQVLRFSEESANSKRLGTFLPWRWKQQITTKLRYMYIKLRHIPKDVTLMQNTSQRPWKISVRPVRCFSSLSLVWRY